MSDSLDTWLWMATVATAVAAGVLSMAGARRQRQSQAEGGQGRAGYRLVMASYVLMTVSIGIFVVRGFL